VHPDDSTQQKCTLKPTVIEHNNEHRQHFP